MFETIDVVCLHNGVTRKADVISQSLKSLRVVLVGSHLPVTLTRPAPIGPFVGRVAGMELKAEVAS